MTYPIPPGVADALSGAEGGVLGLAYTPLTQFFQAIFSRGPGSLVGWLGDAISSVISWLGGWSTRFYAGITSPFAILLSLGKVVWEDVWVHSADAVAGTALAAEALAEVSLPTLRDWAAKGIDTLGADIGTLTHSVVEDVSAVRGYTDTVAGVLRRDVADTAAQTLEDAITAAERAVAPTAASLTAAEAELSAEIARSLDQSVHYASTLVGTAVGEVQANLTAAEAELSDGIAAARADAVRVAEAFAGAAAAAVPKALDHDVAGTMAGVWGDVTGAVARAQDAAKGMEGALPGLLGIIPDVAPLGIAAAIGALSHALAGTMEATADCTIPNCRNLSQFGRDLSGLLDDLIDGGLIALFIALGTDPVATANLVRTPLVDMIDPVVSDVRTLVGVL